MQMVFRSPAAVQPVGKARARTLARRGTFALEPVDALPRLSERISQLAERSLDANPFFLPEFLEPAIQAIGRSNLRLAIYSDREDLRFFAPVVTGGGRVLGGRRFSVWAHPYAPLGSPLIDRDATRAVGDALLHHMRTSGRTLFTAPHMPLAGASADVLRDAASRHGMWTVAERQKRPVLYPSGTDGLPEFDRMVSHKRRRELDRQLRRLCEAGAVSFMSARTASEIESAFSAFTALEGSGWKGRRGTAMVRRQNVHEFARIAVMQLAQIGHATIDVVRVGHTPIAALIRIDQGGFSIPWKIAFDESFAAFSPGKQLMCDETRRWLHEGKVRKVDPVCEEDNPLASWLWRDREPYGTLLISTGRLGINARVRAGLANLKSIGKAHAKALLRPSKPRPKAVQKKKRATKASRQRR
jgi:CelD/BcsL family acetyltransferase involved in cellulose biosynthesis